MADNNAQIRFELIAEIKQLIQGMKAAGMAVDTILASMGQDAKKAGDAIENPLVDALEAVQEEAKQTGDALEQMGNKGGKAAGGLGAKLKNLASSDIFKGAFGGTALGTVATGGITALTGAVSGLFKGMVEGNAQFEKYETSLTVMLGSAQAAKDRLKELSDFAASTPFELPEVVEAGNQLQALKRYSQATLTDLGDLAAAAGKPMAQVTGAFAKLASGQKGIAVDMFRDMMISVDDWVAATGKGVKSTGELEASAEEMLAALPKIVKDKNFSGMMEQQSQTFEGLISTLKDNAAAILRDVGKPLFDGLKQVVKLVGGLMSSDAVQMIFTQLSNVMKVLFDAVGDVIESPLFQGALDGLATVLSEVIRYIGEMATYWGELKDEMIELWMDALEPIIEIFGDTGVKAEDLKKILSGFIDIVILVGKLTYKMMIIPYKILIQIIGAIIKFYVNFQKAIGRVNTESKKSNVTLDKTYDALTNIKGTISGLIGAFDSLGDTIGNFWAALADFDIAGALKAIAGLGDAVVKGYNEGWNKAIAEIEAEEQETETETGGGGGGSPKPDPGAASSAKIKGLLDELKKEQQIQQLLLQTRRAGAVEMAALEVEYADKALKILEANGAKAEEIAQAKHDLTVEQLKFGKVVADEDFARQQKHLERMNSIEEMFDAKRKAAREKEFASKVKMIEEEAAKRAAANEKMRADFENKFAGPVASVGAGVFASLFDRGVSGAERWQMMWQGLGDTALGVLEDMAQQYITQALMAAAQLIGIIPIATASASAIAGAWAPAASMVSLATFGANSAPAIAGMTATTGVAEGLASLTMLADGGILNKPVFVAGESGAEVVAPLKKLPGILREAMQPDTFKNPESVGRPRGGNNLRIHTTTGVDVLRRGSKVQRFERTKRAF